MERQRPLGCQETKVVYKTVYDFPQVIHSFIGDSARNRSNLLSGIWYSGHFWNHVSSLFLYFPSNGNSNSVSDSQKCDSFSL